MEEEKVIPNRSRGQTTVVETIDGVELITFDPSEAKNLERTLFTQIVNDFGNAAEGQLALMTPEEGQAAAAIAKHLDDGLIAAEFLAADNGRKPLTADVTAELARVLRLLKTKLPDTPPQPGETQAQFRSRRIAQILTKITSNDFDSKGARHALNLLLPAVRTGVTVFLCQIFQSWVAFELKKLDTEENHPSAFTIATVSLAVLNLALNIGGAALAFKKGTYTIRAMSARMFMSCAVTGIGCGLYAVGAWEAFAARAPSFFAFCYLRDFIQTFWRLGNNVSSMPNSAIATGGSIYSVAQFGVNVGTGLGTPLAGASGLPAFNMTEPESIIELRRSSLNIPQTSGKSAMNGVADFMDDWLAPYAMRSLGKDAGVLSQKLLKLQEREHQALQEILLVYARKLLVPDAPRRVLLNKINATMYLRLAAYLDARLKISESKRERTILDTISKSKKQLLQVEAIGYEETELASTILRKMQDLPDFLTLDSQLRELLTDLVKKGNAENQINELVREHWAAEIYARTFADTYNPIGPTDLQQGIWDALLRDNPRAFASQLMQQWREATQEERKKIIASAKEGALGTRISMVFATDQIVQRATTSLLTTTVARQEFYWIVFGLVFICAKFIQSTYEEEDYVLLESLVVALVAFIGYFPFYASHDEKPGKKKAIQLPGGSGAVTESVETTDDIEQEDTVGRLLQIVPSELQWTKLSYRELGDDWTSGVIKPPELNVIELVSDLVANKKPKAGKDAIYLARNKSENLNDPRCIIDMMLLYLNNNNLKRRVSSETLDGARKKKIGTVFQKLATLRLPGNVSSLGYLKYFKPESAMFMPEVNVFSVSVSVGSDHHERTVVIARDRQSRSTWYCLDPNGSVLALRSSDARNALLSWLEYMETASAEVLFPVPQHAQEPVIQEFVKPIAEGNRDRDYYWLQEERYTTHPEFGIALYYAFEALGHELDKKLGDPVTRLETISDCRFHLLRLAEAYKWPLPYELLYALNRMRRERRSSSQSSDSDSDSDSSS